MNNIAFEVIDKYAKELAQMRGCCRKKWKILAIFDGMCYETRDGADFAHLKRGDVEIMGTSGAYPVEYELLRADNEIGAIVLSRTPYCMETAARGRTLRAALDDMAQIVGCQVRPVVYGEKSVIKALRKAAGCFIKDGPGGTCYTMTTGRNLFEAVVALDVLEKSAEVNLKADVLGGVKSIPRAEAKLMRMNYKKNYSKAEQLVKAKEGWNE